MLKLKKLTAFLCTLSLVASLFVSAVSADAGDTYKVWNGTATAPTSGTGTTENDPILITSAEELAWLVRQSADETSGKHYKLTTDVYLNKMSDLTYDADGYVNAYNLVHWPNAWGFDLGLYGEFAGVFDGAGHTVYGMENSWAPNGYWGLFGTLGGNATVKNVNIDSAFYKRDNGTSWGATNTYAAGIAGRVNGSNVTVSNCTVYRSYFTEQSPGWANAAGIIGVSSTNKNIVVSNCGADVKIAMRSDYENAGILNDNWYGDGVAVKVTNCWSNLYPVDKSNTANGRVLFTNCYTLSAPASKLNIESLSGVTVVSGSVKGEAAKATMPNLTWDTDWKTVENANPMPMLNTAAEPEKPAKPSAWSGNVDQEYAGEGTEVSPYLITSAAELAGLVTLGNAATTGKYYRLTVDVDLQGKAWYTSLAPKADSTAHTETNVFNGTFDGNGHTVANAKIDYDSSRAYGVGLGLFPAISNNTHIKNLHVTGMYFDGYANGSAGALFGIAYLSNGYDPVDGDYSTSYPTIEYCYSDANSLIKGNVGGGGGIGGTVIGGFLRIANCYFDGTATNSAIVGDAYNGDGCVFVHNCYATKYVFVEKTQIKYYNCYTTNTESVKGTLLTSEQMTGENAKTNMSGFDFDNIWQTVDGKMPTLKVFNSTTASQSVINSSSADNAVKFVAKFNFAGNNASEVSDGVINVRADGVNKTVKEAGIVILRKGAAEYELDAIGNDPITGYRVVGYEKGNVNKDKLALADSAVTVAATVNGSFGYNAKSYIVYTDGTVDFGALYTAEPVGTASADGLFANDVYTVGDANFDGTVDISDLVRMKKYKALADFNAAVAIDVLDMTSDNGFSADDLATLRIVLLNGASSEEGEAHPFRLVWSDEFDTASLDTEKWGFTDNMGGASDMCLVKGSSVQRIAKNDSGDSYLNLRAYTTNSGGWDNYVAVNSIATRDTMSFKYGYLEVRAKLPHGKGAWPSFWMVSADKSTSYQAEIDFLEVNGNGIANSNLHKWYYGGSHNNIGGIGGVTVPEDNDWHTYGMEWDADKLVMYIDGKEFARRNLNENFGASADGMEGFRNEVYLIINNHLITKGYTDSDNGSWAKGCEVGDDFTESFYDIDYVRLYQKNDGKSTITLK